MPMKRRCRRKLELRLDTKRLLPRGQRCRETCELHHQDGQVERVLLTAAVCEVCPEDEEGQQWPDHLRLRLGRAHIGDRSDQEQSSGVWRLWSDLHADWSHESNKGRKEFSDVEGLLPRPDVLSLKRKLSTSSLRRDISNDIIGDEMRPECQALRTVDVWGCR